ncbi:peptidoglycan-binding protein [Comamonas serinivorans]|uniref:Peptidoglycan-binding protein n=1 Tax=Comamonas serinivorans TaxID=1082851 RepID=A0A1Y0EMJ5_9BURK|nr:DUF4384 domain-containing protein [Comamonas serinivorans]ARU04884.1 peptidoglycan-binding protein [Comamonas serinivorans]
MTRISWAFGAALGSLLLGACTTPLDPRRDVELQSHASAAARPVVRPLRSISSFTDSLACMDQLLRDADLPTTLITSKQIPDYSAKVAVASKDMIITAISQMSRLSNAFRYVDFEVDIARQDTVQNLTTLLLNNNQMQLQRPALYVSGAISYVDQNVLNNRWDAGLSGSRIEAGYSTNRNATLLGLEMHLGDFRTRTLIPGLDSANEVIFGTGGQGLDLAGRIGTYGVHFNVGRDYTQGTGAATRTLVDLAMIELLGKWARVPYWQCLTLDQTHPDFQRVLRDWYEQGSPASRQKLVQRSLTNQGYLPGDAPALPVNAPQWRSAIGRFQADNNMVVTGALDFVTYERALRHYVTLDETGKITQVGWGPKGGDLQVASNAPLRIDMQVENPVPDRTRFESGTQVFISARVNRAAYFYCFMSDGQGNVIRLLPNSANPNALISAGNSVRIPDWMAPNPGFVLDTGVPGTEAVGCLATEEDMLGRLPNVVAVPALTLVQDVNGLAGVQAEFARANDGQPFAMQSVQWQVLPRRTPSTAELQAPPPAPASPAASRQPARSPSRR